MPRQATHGEVKQYIHDEQKRLNNPPVGLVTAETDHLNGKRAYKFDPHLDPQLEWGGKTEGTSFDVDTVSLHVHERIDPLTIIKAVRSKAPQQQPTLFGYFENKENNPPIRDAIEFYKHSQGWSNRLVAGDSLLVMNSLLEKEGMARKVQMVYMDPPYAIRYGSNFQPFVNNRDVQDGKDEDLTQEPEMIKAFRDTWELEIHSYLTYLRNRLLLARELLHETGSCFVQINDERVHYVKQIMAEVFGPENYVAVIVFRKKTMPLGAKYLECMHDYIVWYAKDKKVVKYKQLFQEQNVEGDFHWGRIELPDGSRRAMTKEEINNHSFLPQGSKIYRLVPLWPASFSAKAVYPVAFRGKTYLPPKGLCWMTGPEGMKKLITANRIEPEGEGNLRYVFFLGDYDLRKMVSSWDDTVGARNQRYVIETSDKVIMRCLIMTTEPGDLILDPTCGGGTSAFVAEMYGRRWITCDTSRVSITLAKERLMTSLFAYYKLTNETVGIDGGLEYDSVTRISAKSIIDNPEIRDGVAETEIDGLLKKHSDRQYLYDRPSIDASKRRVTGPFTVEAVPSPRAREIGETDNTAGYADNSIARSGQTLRQTEWIDEMLSTGIRGKNGQILEFARIEPLGGTRWIHAEAETKEGKKAVISFGPDYAPLEQRQVELAVEEAQELVPKPKLVVFASFQFDPEAAKDLEELKWPGVDVLKVQMNTDLLTSDLKKKRASNESFWLIGQPDVDIKKQRNEYQVTVEGFDYYNTRTGAIESGDASKIAMWELDTDYDGRSLYPRQVFFPMSGSNEGWSRLAKNLKTEIDEELIESYRGNKSLPFSLGSNKQVAVKIIDDRGIESLKVVKIRE